MKDDPKYQKLLIKDYQHWTAYLHPDQSVLGRCYLWCKREDAEDLLETTEEERTELFEIAKELKMVLDQLFQPDLFNYSSLQNTTNHLHLHILPRYADAREFEGKIFEDQHFGRAHVTNPEFDIPEEILITIKNTFQNHLTNKS